MPPVAHRTLHGKLEGHSLYVTSRTDPLLPFVESFHKKYIVPTFDARESEDVTLWIERLEDQVDEGPLQAIAEASPPASCSTAAGSSPTHRPSIAHVTQRPSQAELDNDPVVFSPIDFEFLVAFVVRDADQVVLGGASHEIYFNARSALISFLVVDPALRGMGAAGELIKCVTENASRLLTHVLGAAFTCEALFIEVLQVRDDHDEGEDEAASRPDEHERHLHHHYSLKHQQPHRPHNATSSTAKEGNNEVLSQQQQAQQQRFRSAERQIIFKKLGFTALDYDLLHPGTMRGHRYNLGVLRTQCQTIKSTQDENRKSVEEKGEKEEEEEEEEELVFHVRVLLPFLKGLILGILADEGASEEDSAAQWAEYNEPLQGKVFVGAGDEYWR